MSVSKPRILVVDDESSTCRLLEDYLSRSGCVVQSVNSGAQMFDALSASTLPDVILLDLELPDTHGLVLLRELRTRYAEMGIIIISGSAHDVDMVVALESGADDFVAKPLTERSLLARIRSLLRRVGSTVADATARNVARFDGLELDLSAHRLTGRDGQEIRLTSHEYQLLELLIENANRVLYRDRIVERINEQGYLSSDRSVDVLVSKLRRKIEADVANPALIKTVRGFGYVFTTRVELLDP